MIPTSLKIDSGLKDEFFTIKPKAGDIVSDEVRKAKYEFGQYMIRPKPVLRQSTDAEVKAELERMLKDSKRMANELKATSPQHEASVWWTAWPWATAGVALAGVGLILYRRRRA